jgi:hypothetical protein
MVFIALEMVQTLISVITAPKVWVPKQKGISWIVQLFSSYQTALYNFFFLFNHAASVVNKRQ